MLKQENYAEKNPPFIPCIDRRVKTLNMKGMKNMEIQITQDIRKYKTKDIGNFSFKEAGFLAVGIGAGFLVYKLTGNMEGAVLPMMIVFVIGFFKPFGMTFPQFLKTVVKESILTPRIYINESDFEYAPDDTDFVKLQKENINVGLKRFNEQLAEEQSEFSFPLLEEDEEVAVSEEWHVIQTNTPVKYTKAEKLRIAK